MIIEIGYCTVKSVHYDHLTQGWYAHVWDARRKESLVFQPNHHKCSFELTMLWLSRELIRLYQYDLGNEYGDTDCKYWYTFKSWNKKKRDPPRTLKHLYNLLDLKPDDELVKRDKLERRD